jgi:hypothetical protein
MIEIIGDVKFTNIIEINGDVIVLKNILEISGDVKTPKYFRNWGRCHN